MKAAQRKEAMLKGEKHYFTGKPCKHGHIEKRLTVNGACVECDRIKNHRRYDYYKDWVSNNKHKVKKIAADYQKNNKDKVNSRTAIRRGVRLKATPTWLSPEHKKQMEVEYALAQWCSEVMNEVYHVDHIIPLNNPTVCGLHVPWNLQVIPAKDNIKKSNKWQN